MRLDDILRSDVGHELALGADEDPSLEVGEASMEVEPGFCVECGDQAADLHCAACEEDFCDVCSTVIHRVSQYNYYYYY